MTNSNDYTNVFDLQSLQSSFQNLLVNAPKELILCSDFPVYVFPSSIKEFINDTKRGLNFPADFTGTSILYAVSVATGNCYNVEVKSGWTEAANLYMALVGKAGTNKSHPLSFALEPITKKDKKAYGQFIKDKETFDFYSSLSKKELREAGMDNLVEPEWRQTLLSDFTQEALAECLKINRKGIGVYADELAGWIRNFNRYNNGSEEQAWLSMWNLKDIRINRKTSGPILISSPFVSVAGTIQPSVLSNLAKGKRDNGFLDRFLFAYPKNLKRDNWSRVGINPNTTLKWNSIIESLLNKSPRMNDYGEVQPAIISFDEEARDYLYDWKSRVTNFSNRPENEIFSGICAKIEVNAIRLSLCLELLKTADLGCEIEKVSISSVKGGTRLAEYFLDCAIRVYKQSDTPFKKLDTKKQQVLAALPEIFKTGDGVLIASKFGMPERTFKRFIQKPELFECTSTGNYKKVNLDY